MQLSRGWQRLLLSWAGAVCLCVTSAGLFQFLGPVSQDDTPVLAQHAARTAGVASIAALADSPTVPAPAGTQATGVATLTALETTDPLGDDARSDLPPAVPTPAADVSPPGGAEMKAKSAQTPREEKRLDLRITRDSERCPKVVCYKWHLVTQRRKLPRHTTVDLARLRLAPSLLKSVDNGDIDLIIEAVEQHKRIHGHDNLVFVATNLAGVAPHDATP